MNLWPATLPAPLFVGYTLAPVDPTLRSDMEVGMARQRRQTAARADRVTASWIFSDAEMAAFRTWFDDTAGAAGGAAWFTFPAAGGNGGLTSYTGRFAGIWQATLGEGYRWAVSATLEVR